MNTAHERENLMGAAASQADREDLDFEVEYDLLGGDVTSAVERIRWYLGGEGRLRGSYFVAFKTIGAEKCSAFIAACRFRGLECEPNAEERGYEIQEALS